MPGNFTSRKNKNVELNTDIPDILQILYYEQILGEFDLLRKGGIQPFS